MKIRLILLLFCLATMVVAASPVTTTLRVGLPRCHPLATPDRKTPGLFDAVLEAMAHEENWQLEFVPVTLEEGWERLRSGKLDLLAAAPVSAPPPAAIVFTRETVISTWAQLIVPRNKPLHTILDLNGKSIAVSPEDHYAMDLNKLVRSFGVTCQILECKNYSDVLLAVENGWVDAGVVDRLFITHRSLPGAVSASSVVLAPVELRFATAADRQQEVRDIVDFRLRSMKETPGSIYRHSMAHVLGEDLAPSARRDYRKEVASAGIPLLLLLWVIYRLRLKILRTTTVLQERDRTLTEALVDRQRAEDGVRHADVLLEQVFGSMRDGVLVVDTPWQHILRCNTRAADLLGISEADLIQLPPSILFPTPAAFVAMETQAYSRIQVGDFLQIECCFRQRSGRELPVDLVVSRIQSLADNANTAFLVVFRDVTERREAQHLLQQTERRLRQAEKMEAIGTLAGGIAHDFNNVLTPIMLCCEMLCDSLPQDDENLKHVDQIHQAAERARALVQQILAFSRHQETEQRPLHIAPIIREAVRFLRSALPATIEMQTSLSCPSDLILADPVQVHQVVMNLCTNAAHAMKERGGVLTLSLAPFEGTPHGIAGDATASAGHYLAVTVSDTGYGIAPSLLDRIFDPFFTTKKAGEGTGMGLSVVHGIVKSWRGVVAVESTPGRGSTFRIYIPLSQAMENGSAPAPVTIPQRGTERIMLVDDEQALVQMMALSLRKLGYLPVIHHDAGTALLAFRAAPDTIAAIISDQTMPGMTGLELAREVQRIRPATPFILCSGFGKDELQAAAQRAGVAAVLAKPFTTEKIAGVLRRVLDVAAAPVTPVCLN